MKYPLISVIIPTLNEERNISTAIEALRAQRYPKGQIEILVIDDGSTDRTVQIAKKLGAKVLRSGSRHIERSKSIGIEHAKGEFILLTDADISLVGKDWLRKAADPLVKDKSLVGSQAINWYYDKRHTIYNRYCELFGVNDPFVYMLKKRGVMSPIEKNWMYPKTVQKVSKDYILARFSESSLPTMGSQGFLARTSYIKTHTSWRPYFFHLDSISELVGKGYNRFALMRISVAHNYTDSFIGFHKKLYRNLTLFFAYKKYRKYTYDVGGVSFCATLFLMVTIALPLTQSVKGFLKKPDLAWFLHPVFCITVPVLYALTSMRQMIFHTYEIRKK